MNFGSYRNPLAQMEEEKREHDSKMKKMEAEMEQVFEMKVKEKKQKLKDSELELTRRHEERKKVKKKNAKILFKIPTVVGFIWKTFVSNFKYENLLNLNFF